MDMNIKYKIYKTISFFFIGMMITGIATAVVVNIDGSSLTPLSWFNSNKTVWDAKGNASYPVNVSNATGVLPNASIPATTANTSTNNSFIATGNTIVQPSYVLCSFQNNWANFGSGYQSCGYMKDSFGFVHLRGVIFNGTIGSVAFVLPTNYIPSSSLMFPAVTCCTTFGRLEIYSNGNVVPLVGSNSYFSLDGVIFYVGI